MKRSTIVDIVIAVVVVAAIVGVATDYFVRQSSVRKLEARLEEARSESRPPAEAVAATQAVEPTTVPGTGAPLERDPDSSPKTYPKEKTTRHFAFVSRVRKDGGTIQLALDYANFLTGEAAAQAAAEAGDESPPPNDFYISNTNDRLREFTVADDARFEVAAGGPDQISVLTAEEFVAAIEDNVNGAKDAAYWFHLRNGVVVGGEEQWTP